MFRKDEFCELLLCELDFKDELSEERDGSELWMKDMLTLPCFDSTDSECSEIC